MISRLEVKMSKSFVELCSLSTSTDQLVGKVSTGGSQGVGGGLVSIPNAQDSVEVQPLAVFYPGNSSEGFPDRGEGEDCLLPEEVSEWVLGQISEVSRMLGVTFEGHK